MNTPANKKIYDLLPVIYRMRDSEQGWPLRALLDVVQEQVDNTRDNIAQLYDDWFIETCAEWVVPYIGDLLGVGSLATVPDRTFSLRSFVGNTVALRRRKGTALVLERVAQDLTLWPARAVEYFRLLAWTQHLAHIRAGAGGTADISDADTMRRVGSPFDTTSHSVDVRHISSGRGVFNIPSIGEYLCRLLALPVGDEPAKGITPAPANPTLAPAIPDPSGTGRFRFSQLGHDMPLFNPVREKPIESRNLESDLPLPLPRRPLYDQLNALREGRAFPETDWDVARAIQIQWTNGNDPEVQTVLPQDIRIADLNSWRRPPDPSATAKRVQVAVDPALGRFAFPATVSPSHVRVGYWMGFGSRLGGGCYSRKTLETPWVMPGVTPGRVSGGDPASGAPALETALDAVKDQPLAVVEITDNLIYRTAPVTVRAKQVLEIRAQDGRRPTLTANAELPWAITLHKGAVLRIAGVLVSGGLTVSYVDDSGGTDTEVSDTQLAISHCTLVPGIALGPDGSPLYPTKASLTVSEPTSPLQIFMDRSLSGPVIHASKFGRVEIRDSAIDGMGQQIALNSGITVVERSTILGEMIAYLVELGSDSIFDGMLWITRTQDGCVRYSYMPWEANSDAKAPRRYHCQPVMAVAEAVESATREQRDPGPVQESTLARVKPQFTSRRYGQPGYLQLAPSCAAEIAGGADNEAEMGVFNHLGQPQRLKNLNHVLNDYLRVGLEAGVFLLT